VSLSDQISPILLILIIVVAYLKLISHVSMHVLYEWHPAHHAVSHRTRVNHVEVVDNGEDKDALALHK